MSEETEEKTDGNERKTHKVTELEFQKLRVAELRESQTYKDQMKRVRENQLRHLELEIVKIEREIEFKNQELGTGIVEKHPDFADGLKPLFFIKNDIDTLKQAMQDCQLQIEDLKKVAEEEK